ncbi:RNA methyltransferase, TrmH family [Cooperia oncophora]
MKSLYKDTNICEVSCAETLLALLEAAFSVMNEERKSQHFLPALRRTLRNFAVAQSDVTQLLLSRCTELLELAQLNTPVALLLSQCLLDSCRANSQGEAWASIVFDLAVFGPIPKKEHKVLNAAYDMIYEERVNNFDDVHRPFEVLQRTRLNGICLALRLARDSSMFAKHLAEHIVAETNSMNKSFFSDVINVVFSNCVDWIVDPCQQFSIKLLLEWVLVRLASRSMQLKQRVIDLERSFANKRIGSVSSWINMMVLMSRMEGKEALVAPYIELILPWTTAQNFAVRCTAVAALRLLYNSLPNEELMKWSLLRRVVEFDGEPAGHFDMQTVLKEIPEKTGMPAEETIGVDLLKKFNSSEIASTNEDSHFISAQSLVYSALSKSNRCAPEMNEDGQDVEPLGNGGSSLVQRKLVTKDRSSCEDCSLVVVASLVDKPNNLGGLCRTCEIFGVDQLVIADPVFLSDTGFKALSMSSEKKQKIEFVRPERLLFYLEEMRSKGYTVIAAEQTTDSTVLLLGDEKEGVPVNLLRCVNQTVEIQQLGQTRSLNVHVSAALFIAKYAEQILLC